MTVIGIDVPEDNDKEEDGLSVLSMDRLLRETKGVYLVHFLEIRQEKKHRRQIVASCFKATRPP